MIVFLNPIKETDVIRGWVVWKETFLALSHKHAPFVERRLKKRNNPWISPDIVKLMYHRDFYTKKQFQVKIRPCGKSASVLEIVLTLPSLLLKNEIMIMP